MRCYGGLQWAKGRLECRIKPKAAFSSCMLKGNFLLRGFLHLQGKPQVFKYSISPDFCLKRDVHYRSDLTIVILS